MMFVMFLVALINSKKTHSGADFSPLLRCLGFLLDLNLFLLTNLTMEQENLRRVPCGTPLFAFFGVMKGSNVTQCFPYLSISVHSLALASHDMVNSANSAT
jgi:hypothetical protein